MENITLNIPGRDELDAEMNQNVVSGRPYPDRDIFFRLVLEADYISEA